ncbi:MAG: CvpA family protein, partial [Candidatus Binataceae bacterium]
GCARARPMLMSPAGRGMAAGLGSMNGLDYAIIGLVALGAIYGISRGALRMITSALSLIGGFYIASAYYLTIAAFFQHAFYLGSTAAGVIGYVIIFIAVFAAIEIAGGIVIRLLHQVNMGWVDRLIGGTLGAGIAAAILGFVVMILTVTVPVKANLLSHSVLAPNLLAYNDAVVRYIPEQLKTDYQDKRAQLAAIWRRGSARAGTRPADPSSHQ